MKRKHSLITICFSLLLPALWINCESYSPRSEISEESTKEESTKEESTKEESTKEESTKEESTKEESTSDGGTIPPPLFNPCYAGSGKTRGVGKGAEPASHLNPCYKKAGSTGKCLEVCDGRDNDCDGDIDEGCPSFCIPNKLYYSTNHISCAGSSAFSPDGKMLVSGHVNRIIRLWDTASGKLLKTFMGHEDVVVSIAFSPDGKTIVSASKERHIILWRLSSTKPFKILKGHTKDLNHVTFSPNGKTIASASEDGSIKHLKQFSVSAFSPNSKIVAYDSYYHEVILRSVKTGKRLQTLKSHQQKISKLQFSSNGRMILSGSSNGLFKIWGCSCTPKTKQSCYTARSGCGLLPNGKYLCLGICKQGVKTCSSDGKWGACVGQVTPQTEIMNDKKDNNCNGKVL